LRPSIVRAPGQLVLPAGVAERERGDDGGDLSRPAGPDGSPPAGREVDGSLV